MQLQTMKDSNYKLTAFSIYNSRNISTKTWIELSECKEKTNAFSINGVKKYQLKKIPVLSLKKKKLKLVFYQ